jgi:hypothetical protein
MGAEWSDSSLIYLPNRQALIFCQEYSYSDSEVVKYLRKIDLKAIAVTLEVGVLDKM